MAKNELKGNPPITHNPPHTSVVDLSIEGPPCPTCGDPLGTKWEGQHHGLYCRACDTWHRMPKKILDYIMGRSGPALAHTVMRTKKYDKKIHDIDNPNSFVMVDVYAVLEAFDVRCPARQHAIKKLLCAGQRGKGNAVQDLTEAAMSIQRAIGLEGGPR